MAHAYIDALKDTGVHIVKFQTHIAEAFDYLSYRKSEGAPNSPFEKQHIILQKNYMN